MAHECPDCDREFDTNKGAANHRKQAHELPWKDAETLRRLYHDEGLSQAEIADRFDCSRAAITKEMQEQDVESDKAPNDPTHAPPHYFADQGDSVGSVYEFVQVRTKEKRVTIPIHRLVAVAYGKLSPSDFSNFDMPVHHETGHGLDNRPSELTVMGRGEHTTEHRIWEHSPCYQNRGET